MEGFVFFLQEDLHRVHHPNRGMAKNFGVDWEHWNKKTWPLQNLSCCTRTINFYIMANFIRDRIGINNWSGTGPIGPLKFIKYSFFHKEKFFFNEQWAGAIFFFYRTRARSLFTLVTHSLTHWLTDSCLVYLIDVTLASEDTNSKLGDIVTVANVDDEDRVGNSLLQIWTLGIVHKAKLLFRLWAQGLVKILSWSSGKIWS